MKNEKIFLRVTKYEKRQLKEEAARRGMTQSELIRSLIARFPEPQAGFILLDPFHPCSKETGFSGSFLINYPIYFVEARDSREPLSLC